MCRVDYHDLDRFKIGNVFYPMGTYDLFVGFEEAVRLREILLTMYCLLTHSFLSVLNKCV